MMFQSQSSRQNRLTTHPFAFEKIARICMSLRKDTRRQFSKMRSGLLGMSAQVGASAFTLEEKLAAALNRARLAALAINPVSFIRNLVSYVQLLL